MPAELFKPEASSDEGKFDLSPPTRGDTVAPTHTDGSQIKKNTSPGVERRIQIGEVLKEAIASQLSVKKAKQRRR